MTKRKSDDDILTEVKRIKNEYDNFISLMSTNFLCCYQCNSTECCHVNEFKFGIQMFKRMITNDIICNSNEKKDQYELLRKYVYSVLFVPRYVSMLNDIKSNKYHGQEQDVAQFREMMKENIWSEDLEHMYCQITWKSLLNAHKPLFWQNACHSINISVEFN